MERPKPETRIARAGALALGVTAFLYGLRRVFDGDLGWQIATGRAFLAHGWTGRDTLTFTANGDRWPYAAWIAHEIFALADGDGTARGLSALVAVITSAGALSIYGAVRAGGGSPVLATAAGFVWLALGQSRALQLRPHVFAPVALALTCVVLHSAHRDPRRALLGLPLGWLWIGLHGSAPLGVGLAFGRLAWAWAFERAHVDRSEFRLRARSVAAFAACLIAGVAANPVWPGALSITAAIAEHADLAVRSTDFVSVPEAWALGLTSASIYPAAALVLVVGVANEIVTRRRLSWLHGAALCAGAGAWLFSRLVFDLFLPLVCVATFTGLGTPRAVGGPRVVGLLTALAWAFALALGTRQPGFGLGWEPAPLGPPALAASAARHALGDPARPVRWYTDTSTGGWPSYAYGDRGARGAFGDQVSLDGRVMNLFGASTIRAVISPDAEGTRAFADRTAVDIVLLEHGALSDRFGAAADAWPMVWFDSRYAAFVRRSALVQPAAELRCVRDFRDAALRRAWVDRVIRDDAFCACLCAEVRAGHERLPGDAYFGELRTLDRCHSGCR